MLCTFLCFRKLGLFSEALRNPREFHFPTVILCNFLTTLKNLRFSSPSLPLPFLLLCPCSHKTSFISLLLPKQRVYPCPQARLYLVGRQTLNKINKYIVNQAVISTQTKIILHLREMGELGSQVGMGWKSIPARDNCKCEGLEEGLQPMTKIRAVWLKGQLRGEQYKAHILIHYSFPLSISQSTWDGTMLTDQHQHINCITFD